MEWWLNEAKKSQVSINKQKRTHTFAYSHSFYKTMLVMFIAPADLVMRTSRTLRRCMFPQTDTFCSHIVNSHEHGTLTLNSTD